MQDIQLNLKEREENTVALSESMGEVMQELQAAVSNAIKMLGHV